MTDVAPTSSLVSCTIDYSYYFEQSIGALIKGKKIEDCIDGKVVGQDCMAGIEKDWVRILDMNSAISPIAPTTVSSISVSALATPTAGNQLGGFTCPEATAGKVTYTAKWYDRTTGAYVDNTQIAVASHQYTVVVTDVAAQAGYALASGFTVTGFNSTVPGTWTFNF